MQDDLNAQSTSPTPAETPVETPSVEPVTNKHVLASQGLVEVVRKDGSRYQISKEEAESIREATA